MFSFEIACFYLLSGLVILFGIYYFSAQLLRSLTFSILIVFVSSEFWEIPIFLMGYLGAPGYGFPHVLHHALISVMAAILIWFSNFKINLVAGLILCGDLALNFMFLLIFPGVVSSWILRLLSLISLSGVFFWSVKKAG